MPTGVYPRCTAEERLWAKIDASGECWIWCGARTWKGYGLFRFNGHWGQAHRFAYVMYRGMIPPSLEIDHLCRNRACVNPAHLEPVTHRENVLRGMGITAQAARRTYCLRGHPFDAANTLIRGGRRECRQCQNARNHEYKKRKSSAV